MILPKIYKQKSKSIAKTKKFNVTITEYSNKKTLIVVFDNEQQKKIANIGSDRNLKQAESYLYKIYSKSKIQLKILIVDKDNIPKEQIKLDFKEVNKESEFTTFVKLVTMYCDKYKLPFKLNFKRNEEGNLVCEFFDTEINECYSYIERYSNNLSYVYIHEGIMIAKNKILEELFK